MRLLVLWRCTNPLCPKIRETTEPLAVDYSMVEYNIAQCPRCGEYTLEKIKEVWDVRPEVEEGEE